MESELSGIFQVKLVTKNIVRGSPGTQFMHMRVKNCAPFEDCRTEINDILLIMQIFLILQCLCTV